MTDYALDALKRKRAEMTGEIALGHARLQKLSEDLEHLDATLRLFAPDFVAESILPKVFVPPRWPCAARQTRAGPCAGAGRDRAVVTVGSGALAKSALAAP